MLLGSLRKVVSLDLLLVVIVRKQRGPHRSTIRITNLYQAYRHGPE